MGIMIWSSRKVEKNSCSIVRLNLSDYLLIDTQGRQAFADVYRKLVSMKTLA